MSDTNQNPEDKNSDAAVAAELDGVPESMKTGGELEASQPENADNRIEALETELAEAQQAVL